MDDDVWQLKIGDQFFAIQVSKHGGTRTPYEVTGIARERGAADREWIVIKGRRLNEASKPTMNMPHVSHASSHDVEITLRRLVQPSE